LVSSGYFTIVVVVGIVVFLFWSSYSKKRKEKMYVQQFKDLVYEYIHVRKILNPFVINRDIEDSTIPREVLRKLKAFEYINEEVKKAKAEMRE